MNAESFWQRSLEDLRAQHLERADRPWPAAGARLADPDGRPLVNFAGNDYLGLTAEPALRQAAAQAALDHGPGATASRLVCGTLPVHRELEARLARTKGYPAALLFGSGYLAGLGALPALADRDSVVLLDRLAHASLLDGAVLSRARLLRFRHNDPDHLRALLARLPLATRKVVVTESVFSMDGDLAPLSELAAVAAEADALLLVDEAHATGVFGPRGAGRIAELGLQSRVHLGLTTFGKALGGAGAALTCSETLRAWLLNRARSFIYTTAPPPAQAASALAALDWLEAHPDAGARLQARATAFRDELRADGFDTLQSASPIVPVLVGDNARALAMARHLEQAGYLVVAIRPPTVPDGTARLRISLTLAHTDADLAGLRAALRRAREAAA